MARFIALSSQVARGHVGLSAMVPALQGMGHEVVVLPSLLLSNHPGHPRSAGINVPAETLSAMVEALDANGWLGETDGLITGYLPSTAHVHFAAELALRVRRLRPDARFICDPVLGDDPRGLYVGSEIATAVRDSLLPLADAATPNRFELAWLSGKPVQDAATAVTAARSLGVATVLATSIPAGSDELASLLVSRDGALACTTPRRDGVPHGTGDFMAAVFAGAWISGCPNEESLGRAAAAVECVIETSLGREELQLVEGRNAWLTAKPLAVKLL